MASSPAMTADLIMSWANGLAFDAGIRQWDRISLGFKQKRERDERERELLHGGGERDGTIVSHKGFDLKIYMILFGMVVLVSSDHSKEFVFSSWELGF